MTVNKANKITAKTHRCGVNFIIIIIMYRNNYYYEMYDLCMKMKNLHDIIHIKGYMYSAFHLNLPSKTCHKSVARRKIIKNSQQFLRNLAMKIYPVNIIN